MSRPSAGLRSRKFAEGITVLELLIALGLLVVLLSFASPSLSGATARAELKAATENMDLNIRMARNAARQLNTAVIMHLETSPEARYHRVSYSIPDRRADSATTATLLDYEFPESVRVVAGENAVRFDAKGMVNPPVQLMLVSLLDDDIEKRILIK